MKSAIQSVFERDSLGNLTGRIAKGAEWAVGFGSGNINMMLMPDGMLVRINKFGQLQKPVTAGRNGYFFWWHVAPQDNLRLYQEFVDLKLSSNNIEGLYFFCGPSVNSNSFMLEEDCLLSVDCLPMFSYSSFSSIVDLLEWYSPRLVKCGYGTGLMFIDKDNMWMAKILNRDLRDIKKQCRADTIAARVSVIEDIGESLAEASCNTSSDVQ